MCIAIPLRVLSIAGDEAVAEVDGVERAVSLMMTPQVKVGDYVIVHAGFAIQVLDRQEAEENLEILRRMAHEVARRRQAAGSRDST
jgi:hydrogenase expression/formation protein HypC